MKLPDLKSGRAILLYRVLKTALGSWTLVPASASEPDPKLASFPASGGFGGTNACVAQIVFTPTVRSNSD